MADIATESPVPTTLDPNDPAPITRPLVLGGLAALAGAAVWAGLAFYLHREFGLLAWGIGGAIGAAMLHGGARGTLLAVAAGALALAAIGTGKHMAFRSSVHAEVTKAFAEIGADQHRNFAEQCKEWQALGPNPDDAKLREFAKKHEIEFTTRADFDANAGSLMQDFLAKQPPLEQWRSQLVDRATSEASFLEFLKDDFSPYDLLFAFLGVATAFGMISKATMAHRMAIAQQQIEARRAAKAAAESAKQQ